MWEISSSENFVTIKFFPHCNLLYLMFEIILKYNSYHNILFTRNINPPPIVHFNFYMLSWETNN